MCWIELQIALVRNVNRNVGVSSTFIHIWQTYHTVNVIEVDGVFCNFQTPN